MEWLKGVKHSKCGNIVLLELSHISRACHNDYYDLMRMCDIAGNINGCDQNVH